MRIYNGICEIDHKPDAVIQCIKLLGQKNPENIKKESENIYSHTNSRGKTRYFLPTLNYKEYDIEHKKNPEAKFHKCIGYYVLYWSK